MPRPSLFDLITAATADGKADLIDTPELILRARSFAPGEGFARHTHKTFDEIFISLSGTATVVIGADRHKLGPGETAIAPRRVAHEVLNESAQSCQIVVIKSPGDDDDVQWTATS